jgi:hypothetical protein
MPIGQFGYRAGLQYAQIQDPEVRFKTPVQYTEAANLIGPTPDKHRAAMDLMAYVDAFCPEESASKSSSYRFPADAIERATGLAKWAFPDDAAYESLWHLNSKDHVDHAALAAGLLHLDIMDGALDGRITEEGRNFVSQARLGHPFAAIALERNPFRLPTADNITFHLADDLPESSLSEMRDLLREVEAIAPISEPQAAQWEAEYRATLAPEIQEQQATYREELHALHHQSRLADHMRTFFEHFRAILRQSHHS